MGIVVVAAYALVQVRFPAPPLIALVGLLGMVLGEKVVDVVKHHLPSQVGQPSADIQKPRPWSERPHEPMSA